MAEFPNFNESLETVDIMDMIDINVRWKHFNESVNNRINGMWNYMMYSQFCDKEIITLKNENHELRRDLEDTKSEMFCLRLKNEKFKNELYGEEKKVKKRKHTDLLSDEFKKVKRFKRSRPEEIETIAIEIFSNLNNINDIINLKNHPKKFDFIANNKFNKLYNIIPALEELTKIIGMDNVKAKIFRSICYFLHDIKTTYSNNEMNHIMIMGPPGVGKTTIAKIMGNIYLRLGFLENDNFITATRSDLVAKYLGQTADKTQKVIDSALGGVLFIDEVYSLGNKEGRDSFAKECIDTINLNMSRTDRPWLLIVGGYKEDIEDSFLAYNKGLERRFTVKLEIKGYDENELLAILKSFIVQEKWELEDNAINVNDIKENKDNFKYYGGDIRKLFQLAKENYCVRSMKTSLTLDGLNKKLSRDDFKKSIDQFKSVNKKEDNTSHLMMYI
jgi:ATP-dependent Clp protease ATP-binding subunit ClpA